MSRCGQIVEADAAIEFEDANHNKRLATENHRLT